MTSLSNLELSGDGTIDILAPRINLLGDVTALAGFQLLNGIIMSNGARLITPLRLDPMFFK